jgi:hypothetical protein
MDLQWAERGAFAVGRWGSTDRAVCVCVGAVGGDRHDGLRAFSGSGSGWINPVDGDRHDCTRCVLHLRGHAEAVSRRRSTDGVGWDIFFMQELTVEGDRQTG